MAERESTTEQTRELVAQAVAQNAELAKPVESILGLFSPSEIDKAFKGSQWSVDEELGILIDIARGSPKWREEGYMQPPSHRVRVEALKELRQRAYDALLMAGGVVNVEATRQRQDSSGNPVTEHMRAVQLNTRPAHVDAMLKAVEEGQQELNEQDSEDEYEDGDEDDGSDTEDGDDYPTGDGVTRLATTGD